MGTLKVNGSVNIQDLLTLKSGTDAYVTPSIAFGTDVLIGYGSTIKNLGIYSSNKIYLRPNNGTLGYSDGIELSTTSLIPTKNNTVALGDSSHKWSNIYATTFTGALSGNASSATKWATARTITIGHKAYTLDGSSNLTYSPVDIFWNTSTVNSATDWNAILTPGVQMVHGGDGFTGTGNPGNGHYPYGGLYTIGLGGTQEHGHIAQFYIPHNMSGAQGIVYRSGWYKTYVSWYTLLDSRNYTSYTVTKTGSGASGTWGINVTGSAGSVAWGNVTGKPSTFTPSSHTHSYLPLSGGTLTGTLTMNAQTGIQMVYRAGKDDVWIYPNGAPNFGIRYFEGDPDRMTFSASDNNNTTAGADLCINGNGAGTVTIRGNTILHAGNYSSYALPKSGGTVNGNLNIDYSLGISQTNGGGNGISLYGGTNYVQNYGLFFAQTSNFGGHGAVTGGWATYFSMDGDVDRGWIFRHANGNKVASISASGIISGAAFTNGSNYHLHPGGGVYVCSTPSITGYLKIVLPLGWTNTMLRFDINIYDYTDQNAVTYTVGGYNYQPTASWYNYSAESRGHGDKANLPVSFGYDGSRCAIYIGWWNTAWSYPQVSISNVLTGYSNYSATWSGNWGIGFSSSNNSTTQVIYNPNSGARTVNYGSSLPSSGYHAGAIFYKT